MKYKNGEEFLNNLYSNMHMEDVVMHHTEKSDTPTEKIGKYLNRLERVHDKAKDSKDNMVILKSFYYDKYVIKEVILRNFCIDSCIFTDGFIAFVLNFG